MSLGLSFVDSRFARRLALGGVAAAVLGCGAGSALRLEPAERYEAAAPQQIFAHSVELAALERAGRGWPARRHS